MPGGDLPSLTLLALSLLLCIAFAGIASRRTPSASPDPRHVSVFDLSPSRMLLGFLCAFLCAVAAILLLPWVAVLPQSGMRGLLWGSVFVGMVSIGVLYALGRKGDG